MVSYCLLHERLELLTFDLMYRSRLTSISLLIILNRVLSRWLMRLCSIPLSWDSMEAVDEGIKQYDEGIKHNNALVFGGVIQEH